MIQVAKRGDRRRHLAALADLGDLLRAHAPLPAGRDEQAAERALPKASVWLGLLGKIDVRTASQPILLSLCLVIRGLISRLLLTGDAVEPFDRIQDACEEQLDQLADDRPERFEPAAIADELDQMVQEMFDEGQPEVDSVRRYAVGVLPWLGIATELDASGNEEFQAELLKGRVRPLASASQLAREIPPNTDLISQVLYGADGLVRPAWVAARNVSQLATDIYRELASRVVTMNWRPLAIRIGLYVAAGLLVVALLVGVGYLVGSWMSAPQEEAPKKVVQVPYIPKDMVTIVLTDGPSELEGAIVQPLATVGIGRTFKSLTQRAQEQGIPAEAIVRSPRVLREFLRQSRVKADYVLLIQVLERRGATHNCLVVLQKVPANLDDDFAAPSEATGQVDTYGEGSDSAANESVRQAVRRLVRRAALAQSSEAILFGETALAVAPQDVEAVLVAAAAYCLRPRAEDLATSTDANRAREILRTAYAAGLNDRRIVRLLAALESPANRTTLVEREQLTLDSEWRERYVAIEEKGADQRSNVIRNWTTEVVKVVGQ